MRCPADIAEILSEILQRGLVQIRIYGLAGRPDLCAEEADHLHNVPDMLRDFTEEKLRTYWDIERVCYLKVMPPDLVRVWETLWERLRPYAEELSDSPATP